MNALRVFDRVHGEVRLSALSGALCSTEEFERLDHVRQLGGCSVVYPSATHTRREHSIGVAHLASLVGKHLRRLYPSLLGEREVLCLEVAGLVHDIGHGPFSHLFEECASEERGGEGGWSHEEEAATLLAVMWEREGVREAVRSSFGEDHPRFLSLVRALVLGEGEERGWPPFLFEIVHARRSGIDVDKMDYLLRDSLAVFGTSKPFSAERLVSAMRVLDGELCFDESVASEVGGLYTLRARMHSQVYQHRAVLVSESLLKRLVKAVVRERYASDWRRAARLPDAAFYAAAEGEEGEAARVRRALQRRPWLRRLPVTVTLNTLPRCASCRAPVRPTYAACPWCGSAEPFDGVEVEGGVLVAPETLLRKEDVERLLPGCEVFLSDITCGAETAVEDRCGRKWRAHHPFAGLAFCDHAGEKRAWPVPSLVSLPASCREKKVHCYASLAAGEEEVSRLAAAAAEWGSSVGA